MGENYQTEQGQLDDSPESKGERDHQGQVTDDTYVDVCMQMPACSAMCKHGYSYIHTRTYACMHTHTHRHIHTQTYTHTCTHRHIHTCTHIHIHTYAHTDIHTDTHTDIYTHMHKYSQTQTDLHTDKLQTCTNTPTHLSKCCVCICTLYKLYMWVSTHVCTGVLIVFVYKCLHLLICRTFLQVTAIFEILSLLAWNCISD